VHTSSTVGAMGTVLSDIVAFLNARLDEAEAVVRPALEGSRTWGKTTVHRALADIAAKQRIVERHGGWHEHGGGVTYGPDSGHDRPCPDLRDLASVYADHPDYDPSWKVDA